MSYLGTVRRIDFNTGDYLYFSFDRVIPFRENENYWQKITADQVTSYLHDPEFLNGTLTSESKEFMEIHPESADEILIEGESSSDTDELSGPNHFLQSE